MYLVSAHATGTIFALRQFTDRAKAGDYARYIAGRVGASNETWGWLKIVDMPADVHDNTPSRIASLYGYSAEAGWQRRAGAVITGVES